VNANEAKQMAINACEGLERQVDEAPDFSVEELLARFRNMPNLSDDECADLIYAFVKALRSGRVDVVSIN